MLYPAFIIICCAGMLQGFCGFGYSLPALPLSRWAPHMKRTPIGMAATGALSGVFNGLTTFSGPPAVIYLSATKAEKGAFRENLSAFFLVLTVTAIPSFVAAGVTSTANLLESAVYLPAAAIGGTTGILLAKKVDSSAFRKTALIILSLPGISGAVQALV